MLVKEVLKMLIYYLNTLILKFSVIENDGNIGLCMLVREVLKMLIYYLKMTQ